MILRPSIISLLLLLSFFGKVFSQNTKIAKVDSLTMAYYQKCLKNIANPQLMVMTDTLFDMAINNDDKRMQAVALCTKLDYYYYGQNEDKADSISAWVKRIQKFAKETNQPKYYYFVQTSRLITYHLVRGEYNIALLETEKVLKEAEAEDYKEGIADCYFCLSNIYIGKQLNNKALEYVLKGIELSEKFNLERYNISLRYNLAAKLLSEKGAYIKAEALYKRAEETANSLQHQMSYKLSLAKHHTQKGEMEAAHKLLEECRKTFQANPSIAPHKFLLYTSLLEYYRATNNHDEALKTSFLLEEETLKRDRQVSLSDIYLTRADIYSDMNQKEEALAWYKKCMDLTTQEKNKNEEITTAEFATLLNIHKLNTEKKELEESVKGKELHHIRSTTLLLSVLLVIVLAFLYHQKKLNRQLKKSRDILNEKNHILEKKEEELRHAKDIAETSSRMKTEFIQNISHEIRTPLNSIVGFSAILSEMFSQGDDEVNQFSAIIEENSQLLLKMINDILDISDLDDDNKEIEYGPVHINECCLYLIESIRPMVMEGVDIQFVFSDENLIIDSNKKLLNQVLENLLNNAAKFTYNGTITLTFNYHHETHELIFTVTDTGIGIPEDQHEFVFERFTKLNEFSQGTGLGLSISKLAAEKLGGYLVIDKDYKEGTKFIFGLTTKSKED